MEVFSCFSSHEPKLQEPSPSSHLSPAASLMGSFGPSLVPKLISLFRGRWNSFAPLDHCAAAALHLAPARPNFNQFAGVGSFLSWFVSRHFFLLSKQPTKNNASEDLRLRLGLAGFRSRCRLASSFLFLRRLGHKMKRGKSVGRVTHISRKTVEEFT